MLGTILAVLFWLWIISTVLGALTSCIGGGGGGGVGTGYYRVNKPPPDPRATALGWFFAAILPGIVIATLFVLLVCGVIGPLGAA